jgi:hypothetical protein
MKTERFKKPTSDQILEFAIVFNDGKIEREKLADMLGLCTMIIDRLYDNGDIMVKSEQEIEDESDFVVFEGYRYWYQHKLATDRVSICLGTKNPKLYCNGLYTYSTKDPGDGRAFVVVKTDNPEIKLE